MRREGELSRTVKVIHTYLGTFSYLSRGPDACRYHVSPTSIGTLQLQSSPPVHVRYV